MFEKVEEERNEIMIRMQTVWIRTKGEFGMADFGKVAQSIQDDDDDDDDDEVTDSKWRRNLDQATNTDTSFYGNNRVTFLSCNRAVGAGDLKRRPSKVISVSQTGGSKRIIPVPDHSSEKTVCGLLKQRDDSTRARKEGHRTTTVSFLLLLSLSSSLLTWLPLVYLYAHSSAPRLSSFQGSFLPRQTATKKREWLDFRRVLPILVIPIPFQNPAFPSWILSKGPVPLGDDVSRRFPSVGELLDSSEEVRELEEPLAHPSGSSRGSCRHRERRCMSKGHRNL